MQCLQLPLSLVHGTLVTASIILKKPLVHFLGTYGCIGMYINIVIHNMVLVVGGAGMAFHRLITYKLANEISIVHLQKIKKFILWIEFLIGSFVSALFLLAAYYTNVATHLDFCRGTTKDMRYIISLYENKENMTLGDKIYNLALVICKLIILFEFLCYVTIMLSVYLHDKKLAKDKVIDTKVMKQRTKKNAITMTGQFLSFLVELGYTIQLLILYNSDGWGIFKYGNISVLLMFCWTAITVIQIGTSPEMRRFLHGAKVDVVVVPNNMSLSQLFHAVQIEESNKPNNDMEMATLG